MVDSKFSGWIQAFFTVLVLWGLNNVLDIYSVRLLDVDPVIYACSSFASAAFFLILYAGKGPLARETMRSIDTWIFGATVLLAYIIGLKLFSLVSATEGTLILRFSLITAVLSSWFFLSRKPSLLQLLGSLIVFVSIIVICEGADATIKPMVYTLMLLSAFLQTVRVFVTEFHRPHNQAAQLTEDPKAKCRVVGFVMFIVSTLFLLLTLSMAFIQTMGNNELLSGLPVLADFMHPPTILVGMFVGVAFIAPIRLLEFSSIQKINTENFLAVASLSFVATWFWEWLLQPVTGLDLKSLSETDILAGLAITFGGLLVAFGAIKSKKNKPSYEEHLIYEAQNIALVEDSREIVANTLEHFNSDVKGAAKALGVPQTIITAFLEDDEKVIAFKNFPDVARQYRKHVAMADGLTGLANRSAFMTALRSAAYEAEVYTVVYIDLDKFKPVNDTYGHEVGDKVLQGIAERLTEVAPKNTVITRMGGDEYCMLLLGTSKEAAEELVPEIQAAVAKPFTFDGVDDEISVSASIGIASYPEDGDNPEELLNIADKGMFSAKGESER